MKYLLQVFIYHSMNRINPLKHNLYLKCDKIIFKAFFTTNVQILHSYGFRFES
jgi:hypothetical protein